jgi:hypothetical protein
VAAQAIFALQVATEGFPMRLGTYWIYHGNVKWTEGDNVREQDLDWKMEITNLDKSAPYEVAAVKGSPEDLMWYTPGKPRGDYLLVRNGGKYYWLQPGYASD